MPFETTPITPDVNTSGTTPSELKIEDTGYHENSGDDAVHDPLAKIDQLLNEGRLPLDQHRADLDTLVEGSLADVPPHQLATALFGRLHNVDPNLLAQELAKYLHPGEQVQAAKAYKQGVIDLTVAEKEAAAKIAKAIADQTSAEAARAKAAGELTAVTLENIQQELVLQCLQNNPDFIEAAGTAAELIIREIELGNANKKRKINAEETVARAAQRVENKGARGRIRGMIAGVNKELDDARAGDPFYQRHKKTSAIVGLAIAWLAAGTITQAANPHLRWSSTGENLWGAYGSFRYLPHEFGGRQLLEAIRIFTPDRRLSGAGIANTPADFETSGVRVRVASSLTPSNPPLPSDVPKLFSNVTSLARSI